MFCTKGVTFTFDSPQKGGGWTYGGYSTSVVVDERYVLRIPSKLDPARAAPLLCAGITTYSPLRQFGCRKGTRLAVLGLGGLGHMAVKLGVSMGAQVTVLSSTPGKAGDAAKLGARRFVATKQPGALAALEGQFDLLLDTVSAPHELGPYLALLGNFGTMVVVGLPPTPTPLDFGGLIFGDKRLAGSNIGGIAQTQEMLDHCGRRGVMADVEVVTGRELTEAYRRLQRGDVHYRFVVDAATLGA
jgi:uncharacterized zinc-type alcohol dehydrogenase-like protein